MGWNPENCYHFNSGRRKNSLCCLGRKGHAEISLCVAPITPNQTMFHHDGGECWALFWELQRKVKPLMTSGGSKIHSKDIRWLQNSKRTNKVQVGNKKRSFTKSCGWKSAKNTCAMNCHGSTQGEFIKVIVSSSRLSCWFFLVKGKLQKISFDARQTASLRFHLSAVDGEAGNTQRTLSKGRGECWRGVCTRFNPNVSDKSLRTSLFWGVNQQHTASSLQHEQLKHHPS